MHNTRLRYVIFLFVCVAVISIGQVRADGVRREAGSSDAARKAQFLLRQLSQEKAELKSENASLAASLKALQAERDALQTSLQQVRNKLESSRSSNEQLVQRVSSDTQKMRELLEKYRSTRRLLAMERSNVALLKSAVTERNDWIDRCKANNDSLYRISQELVDRYRNKSVWQSLKQAEPLTGLGDVKLEVIAEDYRYRIDDLQVPDFKGKTASIAAH